MEMSNMRQSAACKLIMQEVHCEIPFYSKSMDEIGFYLNQSLNRYRIFTDQSRSRKKRIVTETIFLLFDIEFFL